MVTMIKKLNTEGKTTLSILLDTKGPEIRTGDVQEKIQITKDSQIKLFIDKKLLRASTDLFCDYPYLIEDVKKGQIIIIDS